MEYVSGESLAAMAARKPGRRFSESEVIKYILDVCEALKYAHAEDVVHRDIKPGNILIGPGGRVKLADFGVAHARWDPKLTVTGMPLGTPECMAPEQIREEEVDARADIYSLGCILYELGTGRPPYRADTPLTTALYQLQATPPRIEDLNDRLSQGLVNIVYKTLQKQPSLRYQSASDLFKDLHRVEENPAGHQEVEGEKIPQDALEEERATMRRRFRRMTTAAVSLVVLALVLGLAAHRFVKHARIASYVS